MSKARFCPRWATLWATPQPVSGNARGLAHAIGRPPYQWTPEKLWDADEQLDRSNVRGSGSRVLTDIVSLVRFALEQEDEPPDS
jgi:hypothetical protein